MIVPTVIAPLLFASRTRPATTIEPMSTFRPVLGPAPAGPSTVLLIGGAIALLLLFGT